jgi:hypothetical protein
VTAADILVGLRTPPLHRIEEVKARDGAPSEPGFYAWWAVRDAMPGVPMQPHPSEPFGLLYVGIAPSKPASSARLRSRLCRQHIGGNVASSTFRFGLASLLWEQEGWTARVSASGKYRLDPDDNRALSAWQRTHLRVQWAVVHEPWRFEAAVVRLMEPPMNRAHNAHHPFYEAMGSARDRFRASARPLRRVARKTSR